MKWFNRLLLQLVMIAMLLAAPLYLAPLWPSFAPGIAILCWVPAFGLMAYGLSNPEFIFRRFILWASAAVISSSAISGSELLSIRNQLEALGMPPFTMLLFDLISALFLKIELGWPVVAVILFICALEGLRMTFDSGVWLKEKPGIHIVPAAERSFISTQSHRDNRFVISAYFTVSNQSDSAIEVSGAISKVFHISARGELYSNDQMDEITSKHMYYLSPQKSVELNLICRDIPKRIESILRFLSLTKLNYLIDIRGVVIPIGGHGLEGKYQRVAFDFPSRRTIMQQQ